MASPMVSIEGLFSKIVIDSNEGREVANFYVPGSYLHADMPKDNFYIKIKSNICGYNVSDKYVEQEEREVRK